MVATVHAPSSGRLASRVSILVRFEGPELARTFHGKVEVAARRRPSHLRGSAGLRSCLGGASAGAVLATSKARWRRRQRGLLQRTHAQAARGAGHSGQSSVDEEEVWRSAFYAEVERAALLSQDADALLTAEAVPQVSDSAGSWKKAFEALRASNDAEEEKRRWRRAFEAETERASTLIGEAPPEVDDPPGGWRVACEALRARNEALELARERQITEAAVDDVSLQVAAADRSYDSSQPRPAEAGELAGLSSSASAEEVEAGEAHEFPKTVSAFSLFSLGELDATVRNNALELLTRTDLPRLTALFGVPEPSQDVPALTAVRKALRLEDADTREVFRFDGVRNYGGRVFEFHARMPEASEFPAERVASLLSELRGRLHNAALTETELFLQPGDTDYDVERDVEDKFPVPVRLMAFQRSDLPEPGPTPSALWLPFPAALIIALLCNYQWLSSLGLVPVGDLTLGDIPDAALVWPFGPLLMLPLGASMASRQAVAQLCGVHLFQMPLPSFMTGHFGSVWTPTDFLPSRAVIMDIAAAGSAVPLVISVLLTAYGFQSTASMGAMEAPFHVSVEQLPVALVQLLGYQLDAEDVPLLTLSSPPGLEALEKAEVSIPADAVLLSGSVSLMVSALNLLPIGGFDGYFLARQIFGPSIASVLELLSLGCLLQEVDRMGVRGQIATELLVVSFLYYLAAPQRFLNVTDEIMPPRDGVSPIGLERKALSVFLLLASAAILAPPRPYT